MNSAVPAAGAAPRRTHRPLLRVLGATFGVAAAIGGTIGTGILRAPSLVAELIPSPVWFIVAWLAGGAFIAVCANSVAELAAALPQAGGPYVYARRALGDYAGFAVGWADWAIQLAGIGFLSLSVGEFIERLIPGLAGYAHLLACLAVIVLAALNWLGLRAGAGAQDLMSLAKVVGFALLVVALYVGPAYVATPAALAANSAGTAPLLAFVPIVLALQFIYETCSGWYSGIYFAEEDRDPARNMPRALFVGVLTVIAVYALVNLGLLRVLGIGALAHSQLAVADAAQTVLGGHSDQIVTAIAIVSLVGILNVHLMLAPRILFALSRDGLLLAAASQVGARGTPQVALALTVAVALPFAAGVSFKTLFALTAFMTVVVDGLMMVSLFFLRRSEPGLPRPYRARGYPWLPALATLGTAALLAAFVISNPANSAWAIGVLALSYPAYRWVGKRRAA